jgi:hypothetical protein
MTAESAYQPAVQHDATPFAGAKRKATGSRSLLSTDSVENPGRAIQSRLKIAKGNLTKVCDTYMTQLAKAENVVEGVLREENDVEIDTTGEDEVIEEKVQE